MARAPRLALALSALLAAGAIVVRGPPTDDGTGYEVHVPGQETHNRIAASQEVNATDNATDNASGVPFLGTTVTLALTKALDPAAQACKDISRWTLVKLTDLQDGVNQTKEFPDRALKDFAERFSVLFGYLREQLAIAIANLGAAGPALESVKTMMKAVDDDEGGGQMKNEGALGKINRVFDRMSLKVQKYQDFLANSTEITDSLKKLGRSDWKEVGRKLSQLKNNLDKGAHMFTTLRNDFEQAVENAIAFLASRLGEKPEKFDMVKESFDGSYADLEGSAKRVAESMRSSAQMLPPEFLYALHTDTPSGAAAAGFLGAVVLAVAAALAL